MANILLVDDDPQVRNFLGEVLRRAGHQVEVADNGRTAIQLYRLHPPDVLVTDLFMPEKEGLELIMEVRSGVSETRIIAMSGGGEMRLTELLKAARSLGARRILYKPFSPEDLRLAVIEALSA